MTIRVLIVDDHPLYRAGLRLLLENPETEVIGEASSGEEALGLAGDLQPDVVVLDVAMPKLDGVETCKRLVEANPRVAVLFLTMMDDASTVRAALRAGARGYLVKGAGGDDVLRAVKAVAAGQFVIDGATKASSPWADAALSPLALLTARERDVLDLMAAGLTNTAIAERLHLGEKSVRNYVSGIFRKLRVRNRVEAILLARGEFER
ncbi:transcriptional regulator [Humibacter ginsengisoli]